MKKITTLLLLTMLFTLSACDFIPGSGSGEIIGGKEEMCEHAWVESDRNEPNCLNMGWVEYKCKKCYETRQESLR